MSRILGRGGEPMRSLLSTSLAMMLVACTAISSDPLLVAQGSFEGGTWRFEAEARGDEICTRLIIEPPEGDSSSCSTDDEDGALTTNGSSGNTGRPTIIHGLTRANVASVRVEMRGGDVRVATVDVPGLRAAPIPKRAFAVAVPESSVVLALSAFDEAGNILETNETEMPPL